MHNEALIRDLLAQWAENTRLDRRDEILKSHAVDVIIYDVLPPMKYVGADAYRASWDDWQPVTQGEFRFELRDLTVVCDEHAAFAFGMIDCGGTKTDGTSFEDFVRATFCLQKSDERWEIVHQHISMPMRAS